MKEVAGHTALLHRSGFSLGRTATGKSSEAFLNSKQRSHCSEQPEQLTTALSALALCRIRASLTEREKLSW